MTTFYGEDRTTAYEHKYKEFGFKVNVASDTLIQEIKSTFETHYKGQSVDSNDIIAQELSKYYPKT